MSDYNVTRTKKNGGRLFRLSRYFVPMKYVFFHNIPTTTKYMTLTYTKIIIACTKCPLQKNATKQKTLQESFNDTQTQSLD